MHALQETHSGPQKQHQNESEDHRENNRACDVQRRQARQNKETAQKERLRLAGSGISASSTGCVKEAFASGGRTSWTVDDGERCGDVVTGTMAVFQIGSFHVDHTRFQPAGTDLHGISASAPPRPDSNPLLRQ